MKKMIAAGALALFLTVFAATEAGAQCSICTRTAQQMGEKPARGLNAGILYIAFIPFAIAGYVGYRWWHSNRDAG